MKKVELTILFMDAETKAPTFGVMFAGFMSRKCLYLKQESLIRDQDEKKLYIKIKKGDTERCDSYSIFKPDENRELKLFSDEVRFDDPRITAIATGHPMIPVIDEYIKEREEVLRRLL